MRILLDTNILIHREAATRNNPNIGILFNWIERLGYQKWVHPISITEIENYADEGVKIAFRIKLDSYRTISIPADISPEINDFINDLDNSQNDINDSLLLNEICCDRVDFLVTEDRGIIRKSHILNIADKVFTIDGFLEKVLTENPNFIEYEILSIRKTQFGRIGYNSSFFNTFREDYNEFDRWFNRKSESPCYVCFQDNDLVAFLYLKVETTQEVYHGIDPIFTPKKRLKIGTFKVELNGYRLGERFIKIIFDNAIAQDVEEIYVTIFPNTIEQKRLISLLEDFGFIHHGYKKSQDGVEHVYIRNLARIFNPTSPSQTYPYINSSSPAFLVPIYPEYHTNLLPDSILNTESPEDFIEHEPQRNAIRKVYISRSIYRTLNSGDTIIFYRTGGYYRGVVSTIGVIEHIYKDIPDEHTFLRICRKRSVFSDEELKQQWNFNQNKPFIVEFLYAYSFRKRPNLATLIDSGVIENTESVPRGFKGIDHGKFTTILTLADADMRYIID